MQNIHFILQTSHTMVRNRQFWFFRPNVLKKSISGPKLNKWTLQSNPSTKFHLDQTFFFFFFFWGVVVVVDQICSKRVFLVQFEHHPWIQHIRINLSTEFHLKKAIFCTNEHHHRLYHIWVSLGTMFHLKQTILSFGPTLTKTGISGPKQKKCISSSNSAYSN